MQLIAQTVEGLPVQVLPDGRMDAKNAARYCGISVKTMAMRRCDGSGPPFVKQGRIFYFREDLDSWMRSGMKASTAQPSGSELAEKRRRAS